jgi:hypothetical protein
MQIPDTSQSLWRTEFDKQHTKHMLRDLLKQAAALIKRYERYTPRKSSDTAQDRIHTAILKLYEGSRTWDPTRVDLSGFLLGVVASDLTSELRRAKQAPQMPLEDQQRPREDDYTGEPCDESSAYSCASFENGLHVPLSPESRHEAWYIAMKSLRAQAAGAADASVLALLGAYEEGVTQKRDVMALLNWTSTTYKRVYQRLLDLADRIDPTVREAIVNALAN